MYVGWNISLQNTILYTQNLDKSEILDTYTLLRDTSEQYQYQYQWTVIIQG